MPLVFYGTCFSLVVKLLTNIMFFFIFLFIIRRDKAYHSYRKQYCCAPVFLSLFGTLLSFKLYKFFYSRFFGMERFYLPLEQPQRMHTACNALTIMNIVLSLCPMIFVDIYGLIKYHWGNQFYMMMIESLILSMSMLVIQIIEFKAQKVMEPYAENMSYSHLRNSSALDDEILKRLDEEVRKKFDGQNLDDYIRNLKQMKHI